MFEADAIDVYDAATTLDVEEHVERTHALSRPITWIEHTTAVIVVTAIVVELVVLFGSIVYRNVTHKSWLWSPEIGQLALSVIAFLGGPYAYRRGRQPALTFLGTRLPESLKPVREATVDLLVLCVPAALAYYSWPAVTAANELHTFILNLSYKWFTLPATVGLVAYSVFALDRLLLHRLRSIGAAALFVGLCTLAGWVMMRVSFSSDTYAFAPAAMAIAFVLLLVIGVPIAVVFLAASGYYIVCADLPLSVMTSNLAGSTGDFLLLAIPFFIAAGLIMLESGLSGKIAAFSETLVRKLPGGLLHVVVVTMYIFSGLSGSKSADMAAVGSAMEKPMRKHGHQGGEIAAVIAASAIMGETIPPCLTLLILGSVTSLSISALFLGGILPASLLAILLMVAIAIRARRAAPGAPLQAASRREIGRAGLIALPAMVVPVILVAGIASGYATPTEVSSVTVVVALVLAVLYRAPLRSYKAIAADTATLAGMVLFFVTSAHALAWAFTSANIPQRLVTLMDKLSGSSVLFMVGTLILIPLMGLALEGIAAILIFAPLLMPTAEALGINTLQYGLVLVIAMSLGAFAPPIGWLMYEACTICRAKPEETMKPLLSYYTILVPGLIVIAFVPVFSLLLPHIFLGYPLK